MHAESDRTSTCWIAAALLAACIARRSLNRPLRRGRGSSAALPTGGAPAARQALHENG